jgi:uncharacterized FlaG/YvyC family protein
MEIMLSIVESNMSRFVLIDQIEACTQNLSMQEEQIKALNKKLAREKSDAQIIIENSQRSTSWELQKFRSEIDELMHKVNQGMKSVH